MLDDMLDYIEQSARAAGVAADAPGLRARICERRCRASRTDLDAVHDEFMRDVLPYAGGNVHPGFMGWVQGGGTAAGMLAEMLAAGLNANLGGRDHSPSRSSARSCNGCARCSAFRDGASGFSSPAPRWPIFWRVLVARTRRAGTGCAPRRRLGGQGARCAPIPRPRRIAASAQAIEMAGLGTDALRLIPMDADHRMDIADLRLRAFAPDRAAGLEAVPGGGHRRHGGYRRDRRSGRPGRALRQGRLWFHVDGAFGALGMLSPEIAPRLARASSGRIPSPSISTNGDRCPTTPASCWCATARLHWTLSPHRPPICGARRAAWRREALAVRFRARSVARLPRAQDLVHAQDLWRRTRSGEHDRQSCALARHLEARMRAEPRAGTAGAGPAQYRLLPLSRRRRRNAAIVADLQESGIAAPSLTRIRGRSGHSRRLRQPSHRDCRRRCHGRGGAGLRPAAGSGGLTPVRARAGGLTCTRLPANLGPLQLQP